MTVAAIPVQALAANLPLGKKGARKKTPEALPTLFAEAGRPKKKATSRQNRDVPKSDAESVDAPKTVAERVDASKARTQLGLFG
jgi:hypothetical protein